MSLTALFNQISKNRVLVIGDFMLDTYTTGEAKKISPEAPVLVVHAKNINKLPGGAGNVALNLVSLGAKVSVLGRLGDDPAQGELLDSLKEEKINTDYLYIQKGYQTPIKNRVMADGHQIIRIDFEEKDTITKTLEQQIIKDLPKIFKGVSAIAVSDYDKGFLSKALLQAIMSLASQKNIPVIVDPKGKDFSKYEGAYLIKPNLSEAITASGYEEGTNLELIFNALHQKTKIPNIMITRSSKGISLFANQECQHFPVKVREVIDVTGAGDTVLAVLTYAVSNKLSLTQATTLCNLAAGEVIEHLGCARITIQALAELVLNQHLKHKVFTEKYLTVSQFILDHGEFILVKLKEEKFFSASFFRQIKELKKKHDQCKLVIYLETEPDDAALIEFLASLNEVDFILKHFNNLQIFCQKHTPKQIYEFVDKKLKEADYLDVLQACS